MRRRHFLGAAGAAAALALWPRLRARADVCVKSDAPATKPAARHVSALPEALARAARAGKPLLVFVIPTPDEQKWSRGRAFGEWLNHGTQAQLAPLGLFEVVCATVGELEGHLPDGLADEPLMAVLDPTGTRPTQLCDGALAELPSRGMRVVHAGEPPGPTDEQIVDGHIRLLSSLLRDVAPVAVADARVPALVKTVNARLVERPPAGSHWAKNSGCGTTVEETPEEKVAREAEERRGRYRVVGGVGCGMGHVPEKSARFLYFFAKETGDG